MSVKKTLTKLAVASVLFAGATVSALAADISISLPEKHTARWIADGNNLVAGLKAAGYSTDLQYADDDIPNQLAQIENMLTKGTKALIVCALDGKTLSDVLKKAKEKKVLVIAYDRLLLDTPNVDYYTTFDNFQVGVIQGTTIVEKLGLKDGKGPFNIELFGGSPDDNNAYFFYDGALSVLKPYIDSGKLVIRSKQMGMKTVGTLGWRGESAQKRMDDLLSAHYTKEKVNAVLAPNDGLAIGVISALKGVGYCSANQACPVVTGQDAELRSLKSIVAGEQSATVFKDTRELAKVTVKLVDDALKGKKPEINDTKTYNNGKKVVPSYLLKPVSVDIKNYKKVLIDSGYYKESELK